MKKENSILQRQRKRKSFNANKYNVEEDFNSEDKIFEAILEDCRVLTIMPVQKITPEVIFYIVETHYPGIRYIPRELLSEEVLCKCVQIRPYLISVLEKDLITARMLGHILLEDSEIVSDLVGKNPEMVDIIPAHMDKGQVVLDAITGQRYATDTAVLVSRLTDEFLDEIVGMMTAHVFYGLKSTLHSAKEYAGVECDDDMQGIAYVGIRRLDKHDKSRLFELEELLREFYVDEETGSVFIPKPMNTCTGEEYEGEFVKKYNSVDEAVEVLKKEQKELNTLRATIMREFGTFENIACMYSYLESREFSMRDINDELRRMVEEKIITFAKKRRRRKYHPMPGRKLLQRIIRRINKSCTTGYTGR